VSFLGTLEQISLPLVLQRIEEHARTGALVIRQETRWVELYFGDGRLVCIGPVRPDTTLGDRLQRANIISQQVLQDLLDAVNGAPIGETRLALMLMDLGHITRDDLQAWAAKEASSVLELLLSWSQGEVHFEESQQPPTDRLLVSLTLSALLPASASLPAKSSTRELSPRQETSSAPEKPPVSAPLHAPASLNIVDVITETPRLALSEDISLTATPNAANDTPVATITPPQPVKEPAVAGNIDTSFLRPDMVLLPVDLALLRGKNPHVAITPEQWRVITRVDGHTNLRDMCLQLMMSVDQMRHIVGQLWSMGLVRFSLPSSPQEVSPAAYQPNLPGMTGGLPHQGYVTAPVQPLPMATPPGASAAPSFTATLPFENESQWGNGGNGATYVPGQGWVTRPQPMQPLQPSGALYSPQQIYAAVGR
jgi:hypothetical protein